MAQDSATRDAPPAYTDPQVPTNTAEKPSLEVDSYAVPLMLEYYLKAQDTYVGILVPYHPSLVASRPSVIGIKDNMSYYHLELQLIRQIEHRFRSLLKSARAAGDLFIGLSAKYRNGEGEQVHYHLSTHNFEGFLPLLKTKQAESLSLTCIFVPPGAPVPSIKTTEQHLAEVEQKVQLETRCQQYCHKRHHRCIMM